MILVLDVELSQDVGDLFHGGETGGHERQTELILNHAHGMEHGFNASGVAIDEEKLEELGELVVDV